MDEKFLNGAGTCPEPQVLGVVVVMEEMSGERMAEGVSSFLSFVIRAWLFEHCMSAEAYAKMGAVLLWFQSIAT